MTGSRTAALLEKIVRIIPGVSGYQDRERRRDDDKAVRDRITGTVARCRQRISDRMNHISRVRVKGGLGIIGMLEGVNVLLERLEDEIRYAPRGYSGWFDRDRVDLEELELLYGHDLDLLDAAGKMEAALPAGDPEGEEDWIQGFKRELEVLRRAFEDRASVLRGGEGRS